MFEGFDWLDFAFAGWLVIAICFVVLETLGRPCTHFSRRRQATRGPAYAGGSMTTNIDDAVERLTKDCTLPRPTLGMYYSSMEDIRIVLAGLIARDAEIKRRTEQLVAANALADKRGTEIARLRAEITTRQSAAMEALDDGDCSGALAILKNFVLGPMA